MHLVEENKQINRVKKKRELSFLGQGKFSVGNISQKNKKQMNKKTNEQNYEKFEPRSKRSEIGFPLLLKNKVRFYIPYSYIFCSNH